MVNNLITGNCWTGGNFRDRKKKNQTQKKGKTSFSRSSFLKALQEIGVKSYKWHYLTVFWPLSCHLLLVTQNKEDSVGNTRFQKSSRKKSCFSQSLPGISLTSSKLSKKWFKRTVICFYLNFKGSITFNFLAISFSPKNINNKWTSSVLWKWLGEFSF